MEEAHIIEESSSRANSFSSSEGSSDLESMTFPIIEDGSHHHGESEKDDDALFLVDVPNAPPIIDQKGLVVPEKKPGAELEDANFDSPKLQRILTPHSFDESKELGTPKIEKQDDVNRRLVDTAAPFESVRAAVTKFRGIADGKTEDSKTVERQKSVQLELKKVQDEVLRYQKQYEDAKTLEGRALKERDRVIGLVEELKLQLETAEAEEAQAKQDCELANLRLKEMEQRIADNASAAAMEQMELAKERHASETAELKSVKQELESMQRRYVALVLERDIAIGRAADSISASKQIEKTIQDLTLDLITTKELLESAHSARLVAEERINGAALSLELENLIWEMLMKQAEGELRQASEQVLSTNDVKSKLDRASTLLASLKAEVASHIQVASSTTGDELEEVRTNIEKTNDSIKCLRDAISSLTSELEREKEALTTERQKEALTSAVVSSLEAELESINNELQLVLRREKEAREKVEIPKALEQANAEAEQAKLAAASAREELRKAEEEAEVAKAGASRVEMRLDATLKEIEAAEASEKLASSEVEASKESEQARMECEDPSNRVTLPLEVYRRLRKNVDESKELANKRLISATEQIDAAKESESRRLQELEEANKTIEERKKALKAALEVVEKANEVKLDAEQEMQTWRGEHGQPRKPTGTRSLSDFSDLGGAIGESESSESDLDAAIEESFTPRSCMGRSKTTNAVPEPRRRKRLFFARIVMFLARKKVQSLK
ncbi:protein WEAK CHLOROPLAST MOVEMENT UNDER BLUE LIGHT 1-like [Musa acuminata AAA Group]|uniref:protein WEAK CHLOROPLAST MOVEMENT UNDER BLUE LIGHT 1-like n=1 Tax=Musa acuminata AAA Group TaxID=214697 RepID=UPI0031D552AF